MHVHYASSLDGTPEIRSFCRQSGVRLIEDAAHSFGADNARMFGSNAPIFCVSALTVLKI